MLSAAVLQFVHVDDVARVVVAAALHATPGIFHAASSDWLAYDEVARAAGLRVVEIPTSLVAPILDGLAAHMPPALRAPSSLFPYLMHPFVLSMDHTAKTLGVSTTSSRNALSAVLDR